MNTPPSDNQHTPVLLDAVIDILNPQPNESYLDLTAGYGGHARAIIAHTQAADKAVLVDRDQRALDSLQDLQDLGATPMHKDFAVAVKQLADKGQSFDMILADLGVSSPHLDEASRGFSFLRDGPLDMRMDQSQQLTAAEVVNEFPQAELETIIRTYGEERRASQIAQLIVQQRPLGSTSELADIIEQKYPRRGKTHPATRTFQAIRMAVNNELEILSDMLNQIESILAPGGRLAIISFHSLEDRIVKTFFKERCKSGYESTMDLLTSRPILGRTESDTYPRSRSAVLRAAAKK